MKQLKSPLTIFTVAATTLLLSSCAGNTKKDAALNGGPEAPQVSAAAESKDSVSIEAKLAAAQENTTDVTEVVFEKGSRTLPALYQKKIEVTLSAAKKKAPLKHVTLVVWGDSGKSGANQKLATDRGETLKAYIHQEYAKLSTDVVNMEKKPGKLKAFLRTDDVRIQQAMKAGAAGDAKASHAFVIVETES